MLSLLHIENIAVIEQADISFDKGFNVLTGETGAGKSIVIDAISAILGQRAYRDMIRTGTSKASVRAVFTKVPNFPWFEENGVEYDGETVIQRDIFLDGKNVCRVGSRPVTVTQLRTLGSRLLNIHGQHDGQQLLDEEQHLLYLDSFGRTEPLLTAYRENRPKSPVDISFFTDYDKVKSRVTMKLINYERNRELLKRVPYYRFLDLAIVFLCLVESDSSGTATVLIHNEHLTYWGITRDDLYALAMANTPQLLRYDLRSMTEVLRELFADEFADPAGSDLIEPFPIYVLSNQHRLNGSSCILYQHLLHDFARRIGSDFYILPSSVHEVLLIPADNQISMSTLSSMVRDVNSSQLAREEILSDHVYYYSLETDQITM